MLSELKPMTPADLTALEAWLKTASHTIFLATEESVANDISRKLVESADAIADLQRQLAETRAERDRAALVAADEANRADAAEAALAERDEARALSGLGCDAVDGGVHEIIAGSLHNHGIAFPTPEEVSDWVVGQLHAAGYRIIHDSENHEPTLERTIGVLLPRLPRANTQPPTDAVRPTPPPPFEPWR